MTGPAEDKPTSGQPLKKIGDYDIIAKLGRGAMGSVFKARQGMLDRIVALKVLPPSIAGDQAFIDRFVREARSSAKLSHPNVVAGIDVGRDEATKLWYFAMEFVDGPTVKQMQEKETKLPEAQALKIARDVAQALDCAQQAGLVHRDVKPDNILIAGDGTAKLADLGLARQTHEDSSLTQSGQALGTPYYMAPEQARGENETLDTRADLYALGATLFHMVTGVPPFDGETGAVIMAKHLTETPLAAHRANPDVSQGCSNLILKLMQKDKAKRYQTPAEVVEQIERMLGKPAEPRAAATAPRRPVAGGRQAMVRATTAARDVVRGRRGRDARNKETGPVDKKQLPLILGGGAALAVVAAIGVIAFGGSGPERLTKKDRSKEPQAPVAVVPPKSPVPPPNEAKKPAAPKPPVAKKQAPERLAPDVIPPTPVPVPGPAGDTAMGLVGHWKFDEGEGTVARDSSGNGNHGTLRGNARFTKGPYSVAPAMPGPAPAPKSALPEIWKLLVANKAKLAGKAVPVKLKPPFDKATATVDDVTEKELKMTASLDGARAGVSKKPGDLSAVELMGLLTLAGVEITAEIKDRLGNLSGEKEEAQQEAELAKAVKAAKDRMAQKDWRGVVAILDGVLKVKPDDPVAARLKAEAAKHLNSKADGQVIVPTARDAVFTCNFTTRDPGKSWTLPGFDDSKWREGQAGFGHTVRAVPKMTIRTNWAGRNIWVRRVVHIPQRKLSRVRLKMFHDEDAVVYINGVLAVKAGGYLKDYRLYDMDRAATQALKPGRNIIAVHCRQETGDQYIDIGLVEEQ